MANKKTETVLEEAQRVVDTDRGIDYGTPAENHGTTAALFVEWFARRHGLRIPMDAKDVCMFNILQKVSREANADKRDNLVDICGYARNIEMLDDAPPGQQQVTITVTGPPFCEQAVLDMLHDKIDEMLNEDK